MLFVGDGGSEFLRRVRLRGGSRSAHSRGGRGVRPNHGNVLGFGLCRFGFCRRGRGRFQIQSGASLGQAFAGGFKIGGIQSAGDGAKGLAAKSAFMRERKPHISLDRIGGDALAVEIGEAQIVLGDGIAALGFGPQGGDIGFGLGQGASDKHGAEQCNLERTFKLHGEWTGCDVR